MFSSKAAPSMRFLFGDEDIQEGTTNPWYFDAYVLSGQ